MQATIDPTILATREALDLVEHALREDIGAADWTTEALIGPEVVASARIVARQPMILAGLPLALAAFRHLDPDLQVFDPRAEGSRLKPGKSAARLRGRARALLTAERTALNLLARLSGIATATRRVTERVAGTGATILDTRKTTPGLRRLEKYATAIGGATNHRMTLEEAVLIKDNHLVLLGHASLADTIETARRGTPAGTPIEVEVDTLDQFDEALAVGADAILLDNFSPDAVAEAVRRRDAAGRPVRLEASGGIRPDNVRAWAEAGVDTISLGWLTHSAPAVDVSLEIEP